MTDAVIAPPVEALAEYDFIQCKKCGRICSHTEVQAAVGPGGIGRVCPCGSLKYTPITVTWESYHLPQVIRYAREKFGANADAQMLEDLIMDATLAGFTPEAVVIRAEALKAAQQEIA